MEVDGSSTVGPLTTAAAESYREQQPNVNVTVGISGTAASFRGEDTILRLSTRRKIKMISQGVSASGGETDISNASRPIDEEEEAPLRRAGVEYTEYQVGIDALTVIVNPENDWATCLTVDQLKTIWEPKAEGKVTNWNQIDPSFPDQALALAGPGHRLGHVRLLHRRDQRRGGREPRRLHRERGRQRHRAGGRRRPGRPRVPRLHVLRGEHGHAEGRRGRRRRRLRRPERRDGPGRHLRSALATALHLREERVARRRSPRSTASSSTT